MIQLSNILMPTDFSEVSLVSVKYARSLAEQYEATLHCIHVVDESYQYWAGLGPEGVPAGPSYEDLIRQSREYMREFIDRQLSGMSVPVVTDILAGRPFMEIIRYAREKSIDMIVIATHGRSAIQQVLLGGTTEKVVRKAPCPVLTVRQGQHEFEMP